MKLIRNNDGTFTLEREIGMVSLTANEMAFMQNQYMKFVLRDSIEYNLRGSDGELISLNLYPYSFEELVDEIYSELESQVDYGTPPTDDNIKDKIADIASFYEIEPE